MVGMIAIVVKAKMNMMIVIAELDRINLSPPLPLQQILFLQKL